MFKLGKRSLEKLNTCHKDLQLIINTAISLSDIDFGISEGHRSIELQNKYYKEGKSKIDGITKKGKHNYEPSLAVDIYLWKDNKASWDTTHFLYIIGLIDAVAKILYKENKITHIIRNGSNWDKDDDIIIDQTFIDLPHFELIEP